MNDQELIAHLRAELKAMTELHDQKHRDWQEADNARQRLLVERAHARADAQLVRPAQTGESVCRRCHGPNVIWSAPSPLWNAVMRGNDINGVDEFDGIVCPTCFAALAEERVGAQRWRFYAERVEAPLTTVTPSGRVWDEKSWLWVSEEEQA